MWYASLSLKRGFPYFKNFTVSRKLLMGHHTQPWDAQCPSDHPFGKQRSWQRWCEFSVTVAQWKSAQTEAVSSQSPGRHFSVKAVARDTVHLLAKWSQESYLQQVKLSYIDILIHCKMTSESHFLRFYYDCWKLTANFQDIKYTFLTGCKCLLIPFHKECRF